MHSGQEENQNQRQKEGVVTDDLEELRCCVQLLLLGYSILSKHSHMNEANEVCLKACLVEHDNQGVRGTDNEIMHQCGVDVVQENC